jgi:hypothetical protein
MEVQARSKPTSIARSAVRPLRSSSLRRSKIRILPSTAVPIEIRKPTMAGRLSVTGMNL